MKGLCAGCAAAALAIVLTPSALAAHGKVGLWEATVQMAGMPAMANLPPQVQAQMKAHGVSMGGGGITSKFCMTAADVAGDKPAYKQNPDCTTQNVKVRGNTMSADVICTGKMNGRGHLDVTYSSPEHYTAAQTMDMVQEGHPIHSATNIDARWISPNCGNVK